MSIRPIGPVLSVCVYRDHEYAERLRLCDTATPYGLTGAIFARDRAAIAQAESTLRYKETLVPARDWGRPYLEKSG